VVPGLFALALLPRLLLLALHPGGLEAWEYETLATHIASGTGYVITRFGHYVLAFGDGNLYSFLGGALYALVGHQPLALAVVQAVLASLAAPALYAIAERPFGPARAGVGAMLGAAHPGLLAYSLKLHPLGLDVLLLALLVLWTVQPRWSAGHSLGTGLALGVTLMTRPTYFLAGLAALAVRWLARHADRRAIAAAVGVGLLIATPWVVRNWVFVGQPLLASTSFEDVWKGNNPAATGSSYVAPGRDVFQAAPATLRERIAQANELQLNQLFEQETLTFIQRRPFLFAWLVVRKFVSFWWLPQEAGVLYPGTWLTAYQVYAVVMYAFVATGIAGILRAGSTAERSLLRTLAAVGLTLAAAHALAYVEGRHRWGFEPLLLLIAARGMFSIGSKLSTLAPRPQPPLLRRMSDR
jgi:hypothetical protein